MTDVVDSSLLTVVVSYITPVLLVGAISSELTEDDALVENGFVVSPILVYVVLTTVVSGLEVVGGKFSVDADSVAIAEDATAADTWTDVITDSARLDCS